MNTSHFKSGSTQGSALLTVMSAILVVAILSAGILGYSTYELRMNERTRLTLRSENAAESIALYTAEQLTTKLQKMGILKTGRFPNSGGGNYQIYMPPADATTSNVLLSEYASATEVAQMEVRAGIASKTDYTLISDTNSPLNGLQVATCNVPIIAKGVAKHPALGTSVTYVEQNMQLTLLPLFQFGMFYNMDLELYPSAELTLTGPIHTNNSLLVHADGSSSAVITFADRVSAADFVYANQAAKCNTRIGTGSVSSTNTSATTENGTVRFTDALNYNSHPSMKSNGGMVTYLGLTANKWADSRWGDTTCNLTTALPATTSLDKFKQWATDTYRGHLRTGIHGVTKLALPGIGGYKETNDPKTAEDDRQNGRQIIEAPNQARYNGSSFAAPSGGDSADMRELKISWRAGLYIVTNPSNQRRSVTLPNGNSITLIPRSYRAYLNTKNGSAQVCT